jgi:hypothetical protein
MTVSPAAEENVPGIECASLPAKFRVFAITLCRNMI